MTLLGGSGLAAAERQQLAEQKAKMKTEGWREISEGVFERQLGATKVEHMGFGREGLAWTIGDLNRRIERLNTEYKLYPSEKLGVIIADLTIQSAKIRRQLWNLEQGPSEGLSSMSSAVVGASCSNICYGASADAYYLTATQGVAALADAKFNSTCGYSGTTTAYAYARATLSGTTNTVTQSDPDSGTSITSHAVASANGGSVAGIPCYSEASASATSTALGISYSTSDTNSLCPGVPPPTCSVTINGTSFEYFTGPGCRSKTWTATATGCTASTYQWKIGSTVVGTGSTYTKSICPSTASFTLALTINGIASDTHPVEVLWEPCECCGPGICP
jgi:hypothetical protein